MTFTQFTFTPRIVVKAAILAINVTARTQFDWLRPNDSHELISSSIRMLLLRNADNRGFQTNLTEVV